MQQIKKISVKLIMQLILIFTVIISICPILWVVISAFKSNGEILNSPFTLPTAISFESFIYLFEQYDFLSYSLNSLIVSVASTIVAIFVYSMAAYILAKYEFPGKSLVYGMFAITLLVPAQSKAQPIFSLISSLGLYDTLTGLTLVYLSTGLAMSMFILKSTFMGIPKSLDEAAMIEGAGFFKTFLLINFPLAKSGIATAGILMFLANWNEYFYASLLTSSSANRTLPLALQFFTESLSYDYTLLFSALTLVILPGIIIYIFAQESVQESIASAGVKG